MNPTRRSFLSPVMVPAILSARERSHREMRTAGFGWEIADLYNSRSTAFYEVATDLTVEAMTVDVATMILSLPSKPAFCEVLVTVDAWHRKPAFTGPSLDQLPNQVNSDFAEGEIGNPSKLRMIDGKSVKQNSISRLILKTWVSSTGAGSSMLKTVTTEPQL